MSAISELSSDLTTPLLAPAVLNSFDALADGRCSQREFFRAVLETCRDSEPGVVAGVLVLLEEYSNTARLKQYDFRPLQRALERQCEQAEAGSGDHTEQLVVDVATETFDQDHTEQLLADPPPEGDDHTEQLPADSAPETYDHTEQLLAPSPVEPHEHTEQLVATSPPEAVRDTDPTRIMVPLKEGGSRAEPTIARPEPAAKPTTPVKPAAAERPLPAVKPTAPAAAPAVRPRRAVGPTTVLRGRYVLQEEIGRGGVGTVYRALDRNRIGLPHEQQCVALKVLRDEHARRPESLHALRREFLQAQSLSHPGIVNVFDFDFDKDGGIYFVTMELLDGEPLNAWLKRADPRQRDASFRLLAELGEAVVYAHERDILHMDLKPGNVFVSPQGHVCVLDFGLAQRFMAEPWISDPRPIPPAATPNYSSCERLVGDLPDVRDDVYSFACLAYELLSGEHPFGRRSAVQARSEGRKPRRVGACRGANGARYKAGWRGNARIARTACRR